MRRLATQARGETVRSSRDYQELIELGNPLSLAPINKKLPSQLSISYKLNENAGIITGFGGYFAASTDIQVSFIVKDGENNEILERSKVVESHRYWTRIGHAWINEKRLASLILSILWDGQAELIIWGLTSNRVLLPERIVSFMENISESIQILNKAHLSPESYFFMHESPIGHGSIINSSNLTYREMKRKNVGKKCSQCQRLLPIDPRLSNLRATSERPRRAPQSMVLAFHGHSAKRTGYQNECRVCKKFEINEHFNPLRTADQLHESSTLTRERKLFLRENQAIKDFKERISKQGLRQFVWERFNKQCFKCKSNVDLNGFELDHTRPLAYLWPLDQYATCLCSICNNMKKDSFPIEFYTEDELKQLASIIGLPVRIISERSLNVQELNRIRKDIGKFATEWSPRLFHSVASRVQELLPDINLFDELKQADSRLYSKIIDSLYERPAPLGALGKK